ncbi:hypothetical protein [Deminuibacter soli]|uniref:Uncharacterized protein n=1 Tax=Deminuibacter soli TaxID=2291815 RepID=A0A3E1NHV7_9BACT|nr:hypothetical protein [Deminuibacter soli]RFM27482.1 hypothetical protein DXN05_15830 [Deminuibacter soli]
MSIKITAVCCLLLLAVACKKDLNKNNLNGADIPTTPREPGPNPDDTLICGPGPLAFPGDTLSHTPYPEETLCWPGSKSTYYGRGYYVGYNDGVMVYNLIGQGLPEPFYLFEYDLTLSKDNTTITLKADGTVDYNSAGYAGWKIESVKFTVKDKWTEIHAILQHYVDYQCEKRWLLALALWPNLTPELRDFQQGQYDGYRAATDRAPYTP